MQHPLSEINSVGRCPRLFSFSLRCN